MPAGVHYAFLRTNPKKEPSFLAGRKKKAKAGIDPPSTKTTEPVVLVMRPEKGISRELKNDKSLDPRKPSRKTWIRLAR